MYTKIKPEPYPILEFDPARKAIIEPDRRKLFEIPARCVATFFGEVVEKYRQAPGTRIVASVKWESGLVNIYAMEHRGEQVGFFHAWVGAPAAAGQMEYAIAHGAKKIVACGGCGVLDRSIEVGHILVPTVAVRDEGTSYHYLPPSREVRLGERGVNVVKKVIESHGYKYRECKTWTTDAFYRETYDKVALRKAEGCLCVEMECSAMAAVAEFRGVEFVQLLYGGDNLDSEVYDERNWQNQPSARETLFLLSLDACLEID